MFHQGLYSVGSVTLSGVHRIVKVAGKFEMTYQESVRIYLPLMCLLESLAKLLTTSRDSFKFTLQVDRRTGREDK